MARTIVGLNDPKAIKKYSAGIALDVARKSYFTSKMMSSGLEAKAPIHKQTDLEAGAGDQVQYDLNLQINMLPVEGLSGERLEGREAKLKFATSNLYIDRQRMGVDTGDKMTKKRTIHDLRDLAKDRQKDWWARNFDEGIMTYMAGLRGTNDDFIQPTTFTGRANNALLAPDTEHLVYGGTATAKANLAATDKISLSLIDKLKTRATMMGGGTQGTPKIQPIQVEGGEHFVYLMNPWDEYNLRTNTSTGQWLDIAKAAAASEGRKSPIFSGAMGMYNNIILHCHQATIRMNDYGAGSNIEASRNLFIGRHALEFASGTTGDGFSIDWHEESDDRGEILVVDTGAIYGMCRTDYEIDGVRKAFGVIAADVASAAP